MDLPGLGLDLRRDRGQPRRQDSKARLAADLFALSRRSAAGRDLGPVAQRVQTRLLPGHRDRRDHPGRWPDLVPGTLLHPHINGKDAVAGSIRGSMLRRRSRGGSSRAPGSSSIGPTTALTTSTTSSTRSRRPRPMPPSTATSGSTHDHGFGSTAAACPSRWGCCSLSWRPSRSSPTCSSERCSRKPPTHRDLYIGLTRSIGVRRREAVGASVPARPVARDVPVGGDDRPARAIGLARGWAWCMRTRHTWPTGVGTRRQEVI